MRSLTSATLRLSEILEADDRILAGECPRCGNLISRRAHVAISSWTIRCHCLAWVDLTPVTITERSGG